MKYSHHQTKYIGKWVGLRTYQHPSISTNNRVQIHPYFHRPIDLVKQISQYLLSSNYNCWHAKMNTKVNINDYENGIGLSVPQKEDAKLFISPSASNRLKMLHLLFDPHAQFRILFCHVMSSLLLGFHRKWSVSSEIKLYEF